MELISAMGFLLALAGIVVGMLLTPIWNSTIGSSVSILKVAA